MTVVSIQSKDNGSNHVYATKIVRKKSAKQISRQNSLIVWTNNSFIVEFQPLNECLELTMTTESEKNGWYEWKWLKIRKIHTQNGDYTNNRL